MSIRQKYKTTEERRPNAVISASAAFTLVEVMVVMALIMILVATGIRALLAMSASARRTADYDAALTVVQAKIEDIRAATYNPPNYPFKSTAVILTNNNSIFLDQAGVSFQVPGQVISTITPCAAGHLISVRGTFQGRGTPITVTLQTVVNKFSGGQQ